MAVLNKRAIVTAIEMYGVTAIRLGRTLNPTLDVLIKALFMAGEQGFAYDPNDLTTLYQDAAGIIPVTAAGQPVGLMRDKSGRNNHAFQTVSASRPLLQRNATTGAYYLSFDGADDFLVMNNIDFTATDRVSLFAGVRKLSDEVQGLVAELSVNSGSNNGSFAVLAPGTVGLTSFRGYSQGTILSSNNFGTTSPAPNSFVGTAQFAIGEDTNRIRIDGIGKAAVTTDQGTGTYGNYPLYIGRRGGTSIPFNGHIYGLIGIGRLTTDSETAALEKVIAKNTGVTLNV